MKGIKFYSNEGPRLSPRGDDSKIVKLYWKYFKMFSFRTARSISTKISLSGGDSSLFKWKATPRGDKSEIVKLYWKHLKILSLKILGQFSTKFGTKNPWVDGIQIFTNNVHHPSSMEDNSKIIKIYGEYFLNFSTSELQS